MTDCDHGGLHAPDQYDEHGDYCQWCGDELPEAPPPPPPVYGCMTRHQAMLADLWHDTVTMMARDAEQAMMALTERLQSGEPMQLTYSVPLRRDDDHEHMRAGDVVDVEG